MNENDSFLPPPSLPLAQTNFQASVEGTCEGSGAKTHMGVGKERGRGLNVDPAGICTVSEVYDLWPATGSTPCV